MRKQVNLFLENIFPGCSVEFSYQKEEILCKRGLSLNGREIYPKIVRVISHAIWSLRLHFISKFQKNLDSKLVKTGFSFYKFVDSRCRKMIPSLQAEHTFSGVAWQILVSWSPLESRANFQHSFRRHCFSIRATPDFGFICPQQCHYFNLPIQNSTTTHESRDGIH